MKHVFLQDTDSIAKQGSVVYHKARELSVSSDSSGFASDSESVSPLEKYLCSTEVQVIQDWVLDHVPVARHCSLALCGREANSVWKAISMAAFGSEQLACVFQVLSAAALLEHHTLFNNGIMPDRTLLVRQTLSDEPEWSQEQLLALSGVCGHPLQIHLARKREDFELIAGMVECADKEEVRHIRLSFTQYELRLPRCDVNSSASDKNRTSLALVEFNGSWSAVMCPPVSDVFVEQLYKR